MATKLYRGLSTAIRRAINMGEIQGEITGDVLTKLPGHLSEAPSKTLYNSLHYMAKAGDILMVGGKFFTKDSAKVIGNQPPKVQAQADVPKATISPGEALITGKIIKMQTIDGKVIANIEVSSMEYC